MREKTAKTMTALSCKYVKLTLLHYTNWLMFLIQDDFRNELEFKSQNNDAMINESAEYSYSNKN